jgi:membrane-associated phospholipid phosphatase
MTTRTLARAVRARARRRSRPRTPALRGRTQLLLFAAVYVVYLAGRWATAGDMSAALTHAGWVIDAEQATGIAVERSLQRSLDGGVTMWLLSNVYLAAQLVVLPGALLWLYRTAPGVYQRLRDTVIAAWLLALPIYALFPTAPPRLAGIGLKDTVSAQAGVALTGHSTIFYNPIAAVPSLHCGFAFAVGAALYAATRRPLARALALLWGPLVSLSVVATGNHYILDVVAGVLVALAGYAARPAWERLAVRGRLVPVPA